MPDEAQGTVCEGCRRGQVIKRREEAAFRQRSDIGFIHCRVAVLVGVCDVRDARWVDPQLIRYSMRPFSGNMRESGWSSPDRTEVIETRVEWRPCDAR